MPDYAKSDHWSLKARKESYPARSVYKLKEMDEKFGLLKTAKPGGTPFKILDLGAAPGSWSLYIMRKILTQKPGEEKDVLLVSVDLAPLSREFDQGLFDRPEFVFIRGDFTRSEIRETILSMGPYNLIVSDAAPATSGNRSLDSLRSLAIGETVLDYAEAALTPKGHLAVKIFQGGEAGDLLKAVRKMFDAGKSHKPMSSRKESFETYFLGLGKK